MGLIAWGDTVLLEIAEDENKTEGGIILPDGKAQASYKKSRVVSISEKVDKEILESGQLFGLAIGDIVYHAYHQGTPLKIDGKDYLAIHVSNIWAVQREV